jgi:hypothetical protein
MSLLILFLKKEDFIIYIKTYVIPFLITMPQKLDFIYDEYILINYGEI